MVLLNAPVATVSILIWARCAAVSRTFVATGGASSAASLPDEQPARRRAAARARPGILLRMGISIEFGALPPTAAERLEQGGAVGEAARLGLDQSDPGLLIILLGDEH